MLINNIIEQNINGQQLIRKDPNPRLLKNDGNKRNPTRKRRKETQYDKPRTIQKQLTRHSIYILHERTIPK